MTYQHQLKAFTNAAQYLARLTAGEQLWDEVGKVLVNFFGVDLVAFGRCPGGAVVEIANWARSERGSSLQFAEAGLTRAMEEVFENGFLTFAPLPTPEPAAAAFLPVLHENRVAAVMLVGLVGTTTLEKETLDLYLALAGLIGATHSRMVSELAVLQAKDGWERTFESVSDHIALLDLNFRILRANRAMGERLGFTPAALVGLACYKAIHKENAPHPDCPYRKMMEDGKEHQMEIYVAALGATFLMSVSPIRDGNGRMTGGVLVARDISAQKEAEARILRLNRLYAVLSETNKAIVHASDRAAVYRDICRIVVDFGAFPMAWVGEPDAAGQIYPVASHGVTGYLEGIKITAQDEPLGQGPVGRVMRGEGNLFVHNDFLQNAALQPWHDRARNSGLQASASIALQHQGATVAVLSIYATEKEFFTSQLIELLQQLAADISFALDNLERKQRLRASEQKFRTLFEESKDAIFILNPQGEGLDINPAGCEIFGPGAQGWFPLDFTRTNAGKDESLRQLLLSQGYVKDFETQVAREGGRLLHLLVSASVIHDLRGEITGFQGTIHDLTERKHLEEQLIQAQKMESIGLLAGGMAHDFNNILTAIIGYSEIIQHQFGTLDDHLGLCIDQVLKASNRAVGLTRSLLTFSRKQIVNLQPVHVNDIITDLSKILIPIIGEDIEFSMKLSERNLVVLADSGQIDQVLINLATNARDVMPEGGVLLVRTDLVRLNRAEALGAGLSQGGHFVKLTVADNGQGMEKAVLERIFEPFFTTKEEGKGTGLGLSIIYGIIKQHTGSITVVSEPGRGTTFTIYLPVIQARQGEMAEAEASVALSGTETLLVVEDDVLVLSYLHEVLTMAGYTVISAQNGFEAVEQFLVHQDRIDLVLCDVIMPKKNGREVYEEIRRIKPEVWFLFNSGYNDEFIDAKGLRLAGIEYLVKPVSRLVLLTKLREMMDPASHESSGVHGGNAGRKSEPLFVP